MYISFGEEFPSGLAEDIKRSKDTSNTLTISNLLTRIKKLEARVKVLESFMNLGVK